MRRFILIAAIAAVGLISLSYAVLLPTNANAPFARRRVETKTEAPAKTEAAVRLQAGEEPRSGLQPNRAAQNTRVRLGVLGWPVDLLGISFFIIVIALALTAFRASADQARRLQVHVFGCSVLGLGAVFWSLREVSFQPNLVAIEYRFAAVAAAAIFLLSLDFDRGAPLGAARHLATDTWAILKSNLTWVGVAAFMSIIAMLPNPKSPEQAPTGAAFLDWFRSQPRVGVAALQSAPGEVLLVKFNDFQCPPCKRSEADLTPVIRRLQSKFPGKIRFVQMDYPLDAACNRKQTASLHPLACRAAAAVRLATRNGAGEAMATWLWSNQERLTDSLLNEAAVRLGHVEDLDHDYETVMGSIRQDIDAAILAGVNGTPTYFVDGVKLSGVSRTDLEALILQQVTLNQNVIGSKPGAK